MNDKSAAIQLANDLAISSASKTEELENANSKLRELLPDLKRLPGCPTGGEEDILEMSFPPYYTACPNPFIEEWLDKLPKSKEKCRTDPGPFSSDISEGKENIFYKAHSYPTKVPHPAIMRFILHYTQPGDVVLDGFAGTGMTGLAAQACGDPDPISKEAIEQELGADNIRWGARNAILCDLGPSATFISAGVNLPINAAAFDNASKEVIASFNKDYGWLYKTSVKEPNGNSFIADIDYVIWSQVFTCPHCGGEVVFFNEAFDHINGSVRDTFSCRHCGVALKKNQLETRFIQVKTINGDVVQKIEFKPVEIAWRCNKKKGRKAFDDEDQKTLDKVSLLKGFWFPKERIPVETLVHDYVFMLKGLTNIHHIWTDRSLVTLSILWRLASQYPDKITRNALKFWIEQSFWGFSLMNRYVPNHYSHVNQYLSGVYYIPSLHAEPSVTYNLLGNVPSRGKREILKNIWSQSPAKLGQVIISTGSSTKLPVPDSVIDYIFIDPPFGNNIPYSDLAFVVESWHKVFTTTIEEATEDKTKNRTLDDYASLIQRCFQEFYRVLKPGKWMTIEFSNHSNDVWLRIQNALAVAGFIVADTRVIDKEQLSFRQITAQNAVKHDLVISAYKPAERTEQSFKIAAGSADGAWVFVREHLSRVPVTEGTKGQALIVRERQADRIYERMIGYHVARNTLIPMTAAEFYTGLEQKFPVRDAMYFLPEQVEEYERFRLTFKRLAEQDLFIQDESSAIQWLRQKLKDKPQTIAEIQPKFLAELQNSVASWEQLPDLRELLEGNFVQEAQGKWLVPDPKKSEHLDQLRLRALLREYETYVASTGPLVRFRTEAVRAGFKEAWGRRDFAMIVKVGKRLPSEVFIEDSALLHYFRNAERLQG